MTRVREYHLTSTGNKQIDQQNDRQPHIRTWGTRFGFYLAAVGTAFGLGNLWRFPYVVSENGGGAFVLLYLLMVLLIGTPFLVGELLLGKTMRMSLLPLSLKYRDSGSSSKFFTITGWFAVILSMVVFAYYAVLSGWVLYFFGSTVLVTPTHATFDLFVDSSLMQIAFSFVHLILVATIVLRGFNNGVERWMRWMMPVFGVLLLFLIYQSLSLETATSALRFLFYPDFSKLRWSSLAQAIGHVLFTLSLGFGTMVTFGSYLRDQSFLPELGFRVTMIDSLISISAGLMLFPIALMTTPQVHGPEMLFQVVPELMQKILWGRAVGALFFLCLYIAALGACIGLLENIVSNLRFRWPRRKAILAATSITLVITCLPLLARNPFQIIRISDHIIVNWLLPLLALAISQFVVWRIEEKKMSEAFLEGARPGMKALYSQWYLLLKYGAVPIILIALILQMIDIF